MVASLALNGIFTCWRIKTNSLLLSNNTMFDVASPTQALLVANKQYVDGRAPPWFTSNGSSQIDVMNLSVITKISLGLMCNQSLAHGSKHHNRQLASQDSTKSCMGRCPIEMNVFSAVAFRTRCYEFGYSHSI